MGVLGISRSNAAEDRKFERHDPFTALWLGTKETYTIAAHTLVYVGRIFSGRESADQLGGAATNCAGFRAGSLVGLRRIDRF